MGDVSSQEGRSPKLCRKKSGWTVMDPTWTLRTTKPMWKDIQALYTELKREISLFHFGLV